VAPGELITLDTLSIPEDGLADTLINACAATIKITKLESVCVLDGFPASLPRRQHLHIFGLCRMSLEVLASILRATPEKSCAWRYLAHNTNLLEASMGTYHCVIRGHFLRQLSSVPVQLLGSAKYIYYTSCTVTRKRPSRQ
jgi:hypothetical protein